MSKTVLFVLLAFALLLDPTEAHRRKKVKGLITTRLKNKGTAVITTTTLKTVDTKIPVIKKGDPDLANRNYLEVIQGHLCKVPQPRLVKIKACYSELPETVYPYSTRLYECGDSTGCCAPELTCMASHREVVTLYFHAQHRNGTWFVETLNFFNHTQCACGISAIPDMKDVLCINSDTLYNYYDQPR